MTQALRARDRIKQNREKYLGDRKAEVTLLIDSEKITRQWPNVKNQLRYQIKRQNNNAKMMNPMGSNMGMGGNSGTINPFIQQQSNNPMMSNQPDMGQNNSGGGNNDIFDMIREFAEK